MREQSLAAVGSVSSALVAMTVPSATSFIYNTLSIPDEDKSHIPKENTHSDDDDRTLVPRHPRPLSGLRHGGPVHQHRARR